MQAHNANNVGFSYTSWTLPNIACGSGMQQRLIKSLWVKRTVTKQCNTQYSHDGGDGVHANHNYGGKEHYDNLGEQ